MTGFRNFAVPAACLLLVGCVAQAPAVDTTADQTALDGFAPAWEKAYNSGDTAGVVALYADDATLNAPGVSVAKGRAAIQEYFSKDIPATNAAGITMDISDPTDRAISGDIAWETGTWTAKDKSGATVDMGKYVTTYRKRDGKWLMAADIWNSDKAPAPPPAPEPAKK